MLKRQFPTADIIMHQDIFSEESKVASSLANLCLNGDGGVMNSIFYSYEKTPEELLLSVTSDIKNIKITPNGDIGVNLGKKVPKIGEFKLISSKEHYFNAVIFCFDGGDKYNLSNDNDCKVFNAAFEMSNSINRIDISSSVKKATFLVMSDNGFVSISFKGHPIAQQVFDSVYWSDEIGESATTSNVPKWFEEPKQNNSRETSSSNSKSGCYVATAIYGSYDCPQVWTLRRYRDNRLAICWYGQIFIRIYYAISPKLVKYFGDAYWFQSIGRNILDKWIVSLIKRGYSPLPYTDIKY